MDGEAFGKYYLGDFGCSYALGHRRRIRSFKSGVVAEEFLEEGLGSGGLPDDRFLLGDSLRAYQCLLFQAVRLQFFLNLASFAVEFRPDTIEEFLTLLVPFGHSQVNAAAANRRCGVN